jgi:hypothetical protein
MTDAAIRDFDLNLVWPQGASIEFKRNKPASCLMSRHRMEDCVHSEVDAYWSSSIPNRAGKGANLEQMIPPGPLVYHGNHDRQGSLSLRGCIRKLSVRFAVQSES